MSQRIIKMLLAGVMFCLTLSGFAQQQRFPKPEFETGYSQPPTQQPLPRAIFLEYLDVAVLIGALLLVSWFVLKKRSRQGVLWTSVFSLLYFGFYREGCICAIGSIQNVALATFDPTYVLPLTALLFFLIPLITALFAGRTFCAGVCPLGAIQDLVAFRPIELPRWLQKVLGLIPYLYLSLAVLYAATKSEFLICRYDPFVGFFRFDGTFQMLLLGGLFLIVGVFVARPYCRFFCPYGVLLGWMSSFSKKHLTITPTACIQCKLCANSCPFGAIEEPDLEEGKRRPNVNRLLKYLILIPAWMLIGGLAGSMLHGTLSKFNKTVYLAEMIVENPDVRYDQENIDARTFMQAGKTMDQLVADAQKIKSQFYWGGWIAGAFMGLVIGLVLVNLSSYRRRNDYEPDKTNCLSCGRCMDYCPVKQETEHENDFRR
ncbi:4Fe-4S binding protein [Mangrovibacterium diazotrophicum]|uniref:4Fe-4S binding protein n=1 Tax=Mangrovibacterium diazotrophicum TaxID=1261403 RepID=A0A419W3B8_9BACT|nr:4Fe-4S binding protein [Mangrovibacterium diazotrophicum]RKD89967.1 4Fe-4S binding protein [Mangrovibacterium diazotrophicum]